MTSSHTELRTRLSELIKFEYGEDLSSLNESDSAVSLEFSTIADFDSQIAEELHTDPSRVIDTMEAVLWKLNGDSEPESPVYVSGAPLLDLADLRSNQVGSLWTVIGKVTATSSVRSAVTDAAYECQRCGTYNYTIQSAFGDERKPNECQGCESSGPFRLSHDNSELVDAQEILIDQQIRGVGSDEDVESITVRLTGEFAGKVNPGETVAVTGIPRLVEEALETTIPDKVISGHHIKAVDANAHVEFTDDEITEFIKLSNRDDVFAAVMDSIAPSVCGLENQKQALALQLASGVRKRLPDDSIIRGSIHVGLIGDPGTAKSRLLRSAAKLSPRTVIVSGESTSEVGLTAGAHKTSSGWEIRGGALVKANDGLVVVDNAESLRDEYKKSLSNVLESQEVNVSKASVVETLPARASVAVAANPKYGRFDQYEPIGAQVNLPVNLISQFDLLFTITETADPETDSELAQHIIETNYAGEVNAQRSKVVNSEYSESDEERAAEIVSPPIDRDLLRKYLVYTRQNCYPTLTEGAKDVIREFYVDLRSEAAEHDDVPLPITARKLEGLVRLAEASARIRLSDTVTETDAERVTELVRDNLEDLGLFHEPDESDATAVETGRSRIRREDVSTVLEIIRVEQEYGEQGAPVEEVRKRANAELDLTQKQFDDTLQKLKMKGDIYEPEEDVLRAT